ncbi:hypothetical protein SALBM135S_09165 [Streptomyces alboniger]
MITGSMNISPGWLPSCWKISDVAPSVAPKPSATDSIRYQGATRLRSSKPRMTMMASAATGKTTE